MCGRVDVEEMLTEMTPEQMTGHLAAMRAEPWGEERADYRTAYLAHILVRILGSSEETLEADDFLNELQSFIQNRTTEEKTTVISPDEAAKNSQGIF